MAFLRHSTDTTPYENILFTHWLTVLQLLKLGIPWGAILDFTESEINLILGIEGAFSQMQQEAEASQTAKMRARMPNF